MDNALNKWIKESGKPALHLAREIGVSAPYVCDLRYSRRKPSPNVAQRIEDATQGAVPARSWVGEDAQ